eukprot:4000542-Pleurochrysis_carterae.AAC.1
MVQRGRGRGSARGKGEVKGEERSARERLGEGEGARERERQRGKGGIWREERSTLGIKRQTALARRGGGCQEVAKGVRQ